MDFLSRLYECEALALTRTVFAIVGTRHEADDCVQLAFARAHRNWSTSPPATSAGLWVQRTAINLAISRHRRHRLVALKRRLFVPSRRRAKVTDVSDPLTALGQLPVKQLTAVLLRVNHGQSDREIAQTLKISERVAARRVQSAFARLAGLFDDHGSSRATRIGAPAGYR